VLEAASGEVPVIKGSDVISGWTLDHNAVWKARLPKLPPRSPDSKTRHSGEQMRFIVCLSATAFCSTHFICAGERKRQLQPGSFFHDTSDSTLYVWLPDSDDPNSAKWKPRCAGLDERRG